MRTVDHSNNDALVWFWVYSSMITSNNQPNSSSAPSATWTRSSIAPISPVAVSGQGVRFDEKGEPEGEPEEVTDNEQMSDETTTEEQAQQEDSSSDENLNDNGDNTDTDTTDNNTDTGSDSSDSGGE